MTPPSGSAGRGSASSPGSPQSLDGCYFSPALVTDWFWAVVSQAVEELRRNPKRGIPVPERLERNGPLTTIILQVGALTSHLLFKRLSGVGGAGQQQLQQGAPDFSFPRGPHCPADGGDPEAFPGQC